MANRLKIAALKFIYGLLILWIGVLSPLVYFDLFAVNHFVPPYHFVQFEPLVQKERTNFEAAPSQLKQRLLQRFKSHQNYINASSLPAGQNHLFQWAMSQLYLVAGIAGALFLLFGRLSASGQPDATSADLVPPDKPPQFVLIPA